MGMIDSLARSRYEEERETVTGLCAVLATDLENSPSKNLLSGKLAKYEEWGGRIDISTQPPTREVRGKYFIEMPTTEADALQGRVVYAVGDTRVRLFFYEILDGEKSLYSAKQKDLSDEQITELTTLMISTVYDHPYPVEW